MRMKSLMERAIKRTRAEIPWRYIRVYRGHDEFPVVLSHIFCHCFHHRGQKRLCAIRVFTATKPVVLFSFAAYCSRVNFPLENLVFLFVECIARTRCHFLAPHTRAVFAIRLKFHDPRDIIVTLMSSISRRFSNRATLVGRNARARILMRYRYFVDLTG